MSYVCFLLYVIILRNALEQYKMSKLKKDIQELKNKLANKRRKKDTTTEVCFFDVQLLSADPTGTTQKYKRIGALESVRLLEDEESFDNIKLSCLKHFQVEEKMCDILLTERGPSARSFAQINLKKVIHCRFVVDNESALNSKPPKVDDQKCQEKPNEKQQKSVIKYGESVYVPKSISMAQYLKAGQVIKTKKEIIELSIEEFDVESMAWNDPILASFILDKDEYARGGFRKVYRCKCFGGGMEKGPYVLKCLLESDITNNKPDESFEDAIRKSVQMHTLASYLAKCLKYEAPTEFGESFFYSKCYFAKLNGICVTIEEFVEGEFVKYTNNNGDFTYQGEDVSLIAFFATGLCHQKINYIQNMSYPLKM